MSGSIKCSRCNFRGALNDFPKARPGTGSEYPKLLVCAPCHLIKATKTSLARAAKREAYGKPWKPRKYTRQLRPRRQHLSLDWSSFIELLAREKDVAFDLAVEVTLPAFENAHTTFDVARKIAEAAKEATGYRFK